MMYVFFECVVRVLFWRNVTFIYRFYFFFSFSFYQMNWVNCSYKTYLLKNIILWIHKEWVAYMDVAADKPFFVQCVRVPVWLPNRQYNYQFIKKKILFLSIWMQFYINELKLFSRIKIKRFNRKKKKWSRFQIICTL